MLGCLLGGALGDSLGLPSEGMSAGRIARRWGGTLDQRFLFGRGMVSDDTEHAVMTLVSLNEADGDVDRFSSALAWRLRWWLLALPAGIGLGTARSILKLWFGVSPQNSGSSSAGNGPMMRAVVIGVKYAGQEDLRKCFVDASTLMTHRDPRAVEVGRLIADAAAMAVAGLGTGEILTGLESVIESDEMKLRFGLLRKGLESGVSVAEFADQFGRKKGMVSGFAPDTAAVAIFAWLKYRNDFRGGMESVVAAGGDTDTVAFVAGSLIGIEVGREGMPAKWVEDLKDVPVDAKWIEVVVSGRRVSFPAFPMSLIRNLVFLFVVLCHGFRRLLPPY